MKQYMRAGLCGLLLTISACATAPDGAELQAPPAAKTTVLTSPYVTETRVFVGDRDGGFHAFDRKTGRTVWSHQFESPSHFPPAISGGIVAIPVLSGRMVGADVETGEERWSFAVGDVEHVIRDPFVNAAGEIVGDGLLFSSEDFNVYMLDMQTGEERWRVTLDEETQARHIPVVDGVAYVGAWDGYLYAIDVTRGEILWRSQTENDHVGEIRYSPERRNYFISARTDGETQSKQLPLVTAAPVVLDDRVVFADVAGNLLAVDKESGRQLWWFRPDNIANERFTGSRYFIAEHDGVVFYSTVEDRRLFGVDAATGKQVWQASADVVTYGPIKLADSVAAWLRVPNGDWDALEVEAFDMKDRQKLWSAQRVSSIVPFVANSVVYLSFIDGSIKGFDLHSGAEVWRLPPTK